MSYTAKNLIDDILAPMFEAEDPGRIHRRNYAVALLSITPEKSNALVARLVDDARVALTLACRACDTIHVCEAIIPRASWSPTLFESYARAMSGRPQ